MNYLIAFLNQHRQIGGTVLKLALPVMAQSLLTTLVFLIDRAMLGHYGADALASMQISGPLLWSIFSVLGAFSIGSMALVGRAVGGGDRALAAATVRSSLLLALTIGLVAAASLHLGLGGVFALFPGASDAVRMAARSYLSIIFPVVPLTLMGTIAAAVLQAAGNTRSPFLVALLANAVNLCLNYLLIFGNWGAPELGIRGAAIGTVAAMGIKAGVLLAILARPNEVVSFRGWGGETDALRRVLRVSAPAFGEKLIQHLGYLGFVAIIGALGDIAMAANQALVSIESICFESADGIGIAAAAVVAQQLGARRSQSATQGARVAVAIALLLLGTCALAFLLIPAQLLKAFTPDPQIIAVGIPCLYVAAIAQPFMATSIVLGESLRGAGDTKTAFIVSLIGWFAIRLIATYLFAITFNLGVFGVWIGSTCDWIVRSAILITIFGQGKWREVKV